MRSKEHVIRWVVLMCGLIFVGGCSTVPVTGRKQMNFVSAGDEKQLGLTSFDKLKKETPINHDPATNAMVQRVGRRIAAVAGKDLPNAQWEFVVFESKEANAFCLPGGKVGVYTGILPIIKDDAGMAAVLGHETGHAVAHHGAERMSEQIAVQTLGQVGGAMLSPQYADLAMAAYGVGTQVGIELPHSRAQESEADHIGLIYMARAGYDPKEAVAFWQRFAQYNKKEGGGKSSPFDKFLRTHPLDAQRIKDLQKWMPDAQAQFAKSTSN